jgi:putative transcriptional regulator
MTALETQELAALSALGLLDPGEARTLQQRLRAGDAELEAEIASFHAVTGALAEVGPAKRPPPGLRGRLFERIARPDAPVVMKKPKPELPAGLAALARANEMPWKATPFPGIRQKRLYTNTSDGTTVWLVNMDAGAFYPPHHHTSIEHTYVVAGDIVFDGYSLVAGEYQAALPQTDHDKPITTKYGCTVLIINNANDEVFAMPSA